MKVYTLRADVGKYRGLYYKNADDVVDFNRRFDGNPMKKNWRGQEKFAFIPRRLPKGDTPGLSTHIPVFNSKAVKVLADLLQSNGEFLPITCDGKDFFVFNVTRVIDALDEANCELKLFSDGGIMDIVRYAFFYEKLAGVNIFKIPQAVLMDVFVTDPFVDRVKGAGLKGFEFRLVWSSD